MNFCQITIKIAQRLFGTEEYSFLCCNDFQMIKKGPKMDLELDLGPFKICGKDRTEGPFLAEDR